MGTDRYIHGEMNIDFTLWSSDEDYCVRVPRLKKASNRVQSKITTANLEDYNRILNEECKEELGWRSPFEIYYGRKSNQLVKASLDCVDSDDNMVTTAPNKRELACHLKKVKKIRRRAKLYSKKLNDRMVKSHKRRHKAETFKVKEHVLVRYRPQKGG